jgi:transcriptional regulator with XRE-family HTH domain
MARSAPEVAAEFDVGERLRTLRRFRRCTLQTVAARSGLSESFLSQVERGRSNASIASLRRIADSG